MNVAIDIYMLYEHILYDHFNVSVNNTQVTVHVTKLNRNNISWIIKETLSDIIISINSMIFMKLDWFLFISWHSIVHVKTTIFELNCDDALIYTKTIEENIIVAVFR